MRYKHINNISCGAQYYYYHQLQPVSPKTSLQVWLIMDTKQNHKKTTSIYIYIMIYYYRNIQNVITYVLKDQYVTTPLVHVKLKQVNHHLNTFVIPMTKYNNYFTIHLIVKENQIQY